MVLHEFLLAVFIAGVSGCNVIVILETVSPVTIVTVAVLVIDVWVIVESVNSCVALILIEFVSDRNLGKHRKKYYALHNSITKVIKPLESIRPDV